MSVRLRYVAPSSSFGCTGLEYTCAWLWLRMTGGRARPLDFATSPSTRLRTASASAIRPARISHLGDSGSTDRMTPPTRANGAVRNSAQRQPRVGMISRAHTDESAMPAPKKPIIQPTNFPRIREGHNSAKYGGTVELSAPTKNHVKKFKKANTPTVSDSPRHAEKTEYKIRGNKIVFLLPTSSAIKPQMAEPTR